ncbi:MAG: AbrB/MazE/SpoVT family DNA-binding domain-containing protein [archaeon]
MKRLEVELTKVSSRGQVVIPLEIRREVGLREGDSVAVTGSGDTLMLKIIRTPSKEEILKSFERLVSKGQKRARKLGIKEKDVQRIVHKSRGLGE